MSYKTILIYLTNKESAARLTRMACEVARKFDAHLIGFHVMNVMEAYEGVAMHIPSEVSEAFNKTQELESKEIKETFLDITKTEDFVVEWRSVRSLSTEMSSAIVAHARCADLIILPQPDDIHEQRTQIDFHRHVIEDAGRPVLVIPHSGNFEKIGDNVLICWSATKEATRAAHDAIPFIRDGGNAKVFWISKSTSKDTHLAHSSHELATCLDRYGVKVDVGHRVQADLSIGEEILNETADSGIDMIVSGAYGHSRVYDFMIGATSPHLMKHMTVPVLFSS